MILGINEKDMLIKLCESGGQYKPKSAPEKRLILALEKKCMVKVSPSKRGGWNYTRIGADTYREAVNCNSGIFLRPEIVKKIKNAKKAKLKRMFNNFPKEPLQELYRKAMLETEEFFVKTGGSFLEKYLKDKK